MTRSRVAKPDPAPPLQIEWFSHWYYTLTANAVRRVMHLGAMAKQTGDADMALELPDVVMMAVACLEAGINDMVEWFRSHPRKPRAFPDDFDDLRLEEKWLALPLHVGGTPFKKGGRPWQDFRALVELRNRLVHPKVGGAPKALLRLLETRDCTWDRNVDWYFKVATVRTARWAFFTVGEMFHEVSKRTGVARELQNMWLWDVRQIGNLIDVDTSAR